MVKNMVSSTAIALESMAAQISLAPIGGGLLLMGARIQTLFNTVPHNSGEVTAWS